MAGRDDYPLPAHALSVWLEGDRLAIGIPGTAHAQGRTLRVSLDNCAIERTASGFAIAARSAGWAALLQMLRDRATASASASATTTERASERGGSINSIGTKTSPVQYDLEKMLLRMGEAQTKTQAKTKRFNTRGAQEIDGADLGLDI